MEETLPDIGAMSDEELKEMLISGADVEELTDILVGRVGGQPL